MADLGYTDAQHLRLARELGGFLRLIRVLEDTRRSFTRERTKLINWNDYNSNFDEDTLTLTGVHYGTNTAENGRLFVRTTGSGPYTVSLYTASGASGLVAQGSANAGATVTLAAQNSSGLSGSVDLAGSVTAETDDEHQIICVLDWKLEKLKLFPSDGTTDDDAASQAAWDRMLNDLAALCESMVGRVDQAVREWALSAADNPKARGNDFLEENLASLIAEQIITDPDGAVTRLRSGFFEALRQAWADETTGSEQDVIQRVVAAGSGQFSSNNAGAFTLASHTPEEHCPIGRWTFDCVRGLGTGDGGEEVFNGRFSAADSDESFTFTGLKIGQSWKGPFGFGPVTLVRAPTKTGDGSNQDSGAASTYSFTGESEEFSDGGILHAQVVANGGNWDYEFYRSSGLGASDLVAKVTNVGTSTAVTATARNGSGLTVSFTTGSSPTTTNTWTINMKFGSVQNSSNVPDTFYVLTTLTSSGLAARILAELFGYKFNTETSGSEQISDDLMAVANTRATGLYVNPDI